MSDVKPGQQPTLRAERAAVTHRRIAETARAMFSRQGYGATTLTAIAAEAGVAVQTVYAVFGSKAGILHALIGEVLHQPEADTLYEDAMQASGARQKLELFARSIRRRWEYGHDVVAISGDAASTDPAVRTEVERVLGIRRAGIGRFAATLAPAFAPGVDVDRANAILDALTLPAVYAEFIDVHGWTPDEYKIWLATSLRRQLLRG
ncbi:MAG: TetR/AcrR family transcriptional regulator [Chloroflexota bacterium]